jgi:DNA polymerase III subunit delta'
MSETEMFAEELDVWATVIGQERALSILRACAADPVHAYLLVGPAGSGTREGAVSFAAAVMGPETRDQRLVLAGRHPDVTVVERVGAAITVEQAEDVIHLASLAPVEGRRKVLILDEFHLLRPEAAAKLLKTIEEPAGSTIFLVTAESVPPELVTIASRCVRIDFGPLAVEDISAELMRGGIAADTAARSASMARGNLVRARLLAVDPQAVARIDAFRAVPDRLDGTGAVAAALVDELAGLIEAATTPLTEQHGRELAQFAERVEVTGERGAVGMRKSLEERHKREIRRHRVDELRSGLGTMAGVYRDRLVAGTAHEPRAVMAAVGRITAAAEALDRNPNETLLLQSLLLALPAL